MSYSKPVIRSLTAEGDLSARQYSQVKLGTTPKQVVLAGADEVAYGVLMNAPKDGEIAEVAISGGALVKVGGNVAAGASVGCAANGIGKAAVATKGCIGVYEDAGVSGDVVPVQIDRHYFPA